MDLGRFCCGKLGSGLQSLWLLTTARFQNLAAAVFRSLMMKHDDRAR